MFFSERASRADSRKFGDLGFLGFLDSLRDSDPIIWTAWVVRWRDLWLGFDQGLRYPVFFFFAHFVDNSSGTWVGEVTESTILKNLMVEKFKQTPWILVWFSAYRLRIDIIASSVRSSCVCSPENWQPLPTFSFVEEDQILAIMSDPFLHLALLCDPGNHPSRYESFCSTPLYFRYVVHFISCSFSSSQIILSFCVDCFIGVVKSISILIRLVDWLFDMAKSSTLVDASYRMTIRLYNGNHLEYVLVSRDYYVLLTVIEQIMEIVDGNLSFDNKNNFNL